MDRIDNQKYDVIAIDLVNTLVRRLDVNFCRSAVLLLKNFGLNFTEEQFWNKFRKRYLEYSLGNYHNDYEFYKCLFMLDNQNNIEDIKNELSSLIIKFSSPFSNSDNILRKISKHYRLIMASNFVYEWATIILNENRWTNYFNNLCISSKIKFRKPSDGFFVNLIDICKCDVDQILFIGDSVENDLFGALNSNINNIVLIDRENKIKINNSTIKVIRDINDILRLLK
jgi:FMN phosphatase YigB (HAD superfamily)